MKARIELSAPLAPSKDIVVQISSLRKPKPKIWKAMTIPGSREGSWAVMRPARRRVYVNVQGWGKASY